MGRMDESQLLFGMKLGPEVASEQAPERATGARVVTSDRICATPIRIIDFNGLHEISERRITPSRPGGLPASVRSSGGADGRSAAAAGGRGVASAPVGGERPKRVVSEATKRRMAASQQKRWAGLREQSGRPSAVKRKMSAEGRARIAEATRKRWAEYRAQKAAQ